MFDEEHNTSDGDTERIQQSSSRRLQGPANAERVGVGGDTEQANGGGAGDAARGDTAGAAAGGSGEASGGDGGGGAGVGAGDAARDQGG